MSSAKLKIIPCKKPKMVLDIEKYPEFVLRIGANFDKNERRSHNFYGDLSSKVY